MHHLLQDLEVMLHQGLSTPKKKKSSKNDFKILAIFFSFNRELCIPYYFLKTKRTRESDLWSYNTVQKDAKENASHLAFPVI